MSLSDRLDNIAQIWGFVDKPPIVEEVIGNLPTAGINDNGAGWYEVTELTYQREVITCPPTANERHLWQEHAPGVWHRIG